MPTLTIELPQHEAQTELNLRRWSQLIAEPELAKFEGRIETDRHGHIIMSPPPAPLHGSYQARIASLLDRHMTNGRVLTECPISTADGVKANRCSLGVTGMFARIGQSSLFSQGARNLCGSSLAK